MTMPFTTKSLLMGFTIATYMVRSGVKRKSLSPTGAVAAWLVGFSSIACGLRGFILLLFYKLGSSVTKYKKSIKEKRDGDASTSSIRGPHQVLACSAIAVICTLYHAFQFGEERAINFDQSPTASSITCAIIAHYAVCLGDTFSSELGIISNSKPFLITAPWKMVPAGTNGGITLQGTLCSAVGGFLIGIGTLLMDIISGLEVQTVPTLSYAIICAFIGSLLDSLLGATLQASYFDLETKRAHCCNEQVKKTMKHIAGYDILTNAQVNLLSVFLVTFGGGFYFAPIIFR